MGRVFRAHDTKLGRDVALKVLPDSLAHDRERLARLDREAQVLASLNHPNIAHLYGVEDAGATRAIVMELVPGPTLAERIAAGPIPPVEALAIARQVAEALEAAHDQGVVHRDLKPANIKVRDDGFVKVLDFGLAKALDSTAKSGIEQANSPTFTAVGATEAGMILGTAAYMSPEQAKGKAVDKRADIWAFGVVLYEMLTGRPMFGAENVSETLAQVLLKDPDWSALPPTTERRLRDLVGRCLVRDPRNRLRDIGDARIAIAEIQNAKPPQPDDTGRRPSRTREMVLGGLAALFLLTTLAALVSWTRPGAPVIGRVQFDVLPPPGPNRDASAIVRWVEMSPDGRHLAFSTTLPSSAIYIRSLESTTTRLIDGTQVTNGPPPIFFWSPDSQFIGFFADGRIKKVAVDGGQPQVIAALPPGLSYPGGTWGTGGTILFAVAERDRGRLWQVPATGGQPMALDSASPSERIIYPSFLPDGRRFLALDATPDNRPDEAFVGELGSTERRRLPGAGLIGRYASSGHLLSVRAGALVAHRFDLDSSTLSGDPVTIASGFADDSTGQFSVSTTGTIAHRAAGSLDDATLTWFDRTGKRLRDESLTGGMQAPNLSRDGKRVVIEREDSLGADLWVIDLARGTSTRLTDHAEDDSRPAFSGDGSKVAFTRQNGIFIKPSSGAGAEVRLVDGEVTDWSGDSRFISFIKEGGLWAVDVNDKTTTEIVQTNGNDRRGRFSPDGRWIAYESDFSGRFEVYVQRFPPTDERLQVSVSGGSSPYWRNDGQELFFSAPDYSIMSVDVVPSASFQASPPKRVFEVPGLINNGRFVVAPGGREFLMPIRTSRVGPITVELNWAARLEK